MDKNLPTNEGDKGFNPWSSKIPHTTEDTPEPELWNPSAATTELNKRSHHN